MVSATSAILDPEYIVFGGLIPIQLTERIIPKLEFFDINRRNIKRGIANIIHAKAPRDAAAHGAAMLPLADKYLVFSKLWEV